MPLVITLKQSSLLASTPERGTEEVIHRLEVLVGYGAPDLMQEHPEVETLLVIGMHCVYPSQCITLLYARKVW